MIGQPKLSIFLKNRKGERAVKKSKIKSVEVEISGQQGPPDRDEQMAAVHFMLIQRRMEELGLNQRQKAIVVDGVLKLLKKQ